MRQRFGGCNQASWVTGTERGLREAEEENCGKSSGRIGVVMRRVYQLFRCCLLIKHHQTLSLLTINTLLRYRAFPPLFPLHLSFPLSLRTPLSLSLPTTLPLSVSLSLYQTPPKQARLTIKCTCRYLLRPKEIYHSQAHFLTWSQVWHTERFFFLSHLQQRQDFFSAFFFFYITLSLVCCLSKSDISKAY